MNLESALTLIGQKFDGYSDEIADLIAYADEDHEGGRRAGFDDWSIDPDEGKLLYALVRALKPAKLLEIGVREGASTAHLLAAIEANGDGELISYDIAAVSLKRTNHKWTAVQADALTADLPTADFVFEDSQHGLSYSLELFEKLRAMNPRILITHDYQMTEAHGDFHVKEAFDTIFPEGFPITLDGCERGLAIWINPDWQPAEVVTETIAEAAKPAPVKRSAKPRATRAAAKK